MTSTRSPDTHASVVTSCVDLDANLEFFVASAGFRIHLVTPADDPRLIVVERAGLRLELRRAAADEPVAIVVDDAALGDERGDPRTIVAPNGSTVEFRSVGARTVVPESVPSVTSTHPGDGSFGLGRAGMEYRDLLPDRWGGRFVVSHVAISDGGEVADWVHFHRIRFQMIFVAAGWVDVVYEDQGPPFRLSAGDCVLQPPQIRHRVLASSPGLEVIEVGCPAEHDTIADHDLTLPTTELRPDRDFCGQRFVRHVAREGEWRPWVIDGFRARDTGIGGATDGLAGVVVVAPDRDPRDEATGPGPKTSGRVTTGPGANVTRTPSAPATHDGEFVMCVGLRGSATIDVTAVGSYDLSPRSSIALPPGSTWRWNDVSHDHEALVVSLGADAVRPG